MGYRYSSLVEHIEAEMPRMSKGQKSIARFILSDYERAAYMTAAKIGEEAGVSESTVVRFTMELGYEGYPHFQRLLQEELKVKLTSVQRLNASRRFSSDAQVLNSILQADIDNLKTTFESIDRSCIQQSRGDHSGSQAHFCHGTSQLGASFFVYSLLFYAAV